MVARGGHVGLSREEVLFYSGRSKISLGTGQIEQKQLKSRGRRALIYILSLNAIGGWLN